MTRGDVVSRGQVLRAWSVDVLCPEMLVVPLSILRLDIHGRNNSGIAVWGILREDLLIEKLVYFSK